MTSVFDNPFIIATIEARTRAMNKFGQTVELDHELTRTLYYEVARRYRPGEDMVRIIEFVLDLYEPYTNDAERGGYKIAIGKAGHEVRAARKRELDILERERPLPPMWAYEQDL